MQIKDFLENTQPLIYKTFCNALARNSVAHAYLISGCEGMPLKEIALYLAKTLVCDNPSPLACDNCVTCMRIDSGEFQDLIILDGSSGMIKKEEISKINSQFIKTAVDKKGKMIYIIHRIENTRPQAINAMLKFLEEPGNNIYAFLTTENEASILPTIISRCEVLRVRKPDRKQLIQDAINSGVAQDDAELLSAFYYTPEQIVANKENPTYLFAKEALNNQLNALTISNDEAIFSCQKSIISKVKITNTQEVNLYLSLLADAFQDMINISINNEIYLESYNNILREIQSKLSHIEKSLVEILNAKKLLEKKVNIGLILDHVIYEIVSKE